MVDLEEFLREVSAEPPCGPDLTYDADFLALENAARGKAEQQFGDTVIAAEPPDWRAVEKHAASLLGRSKDIRVAILLCRAWVNLKGVPGLAAGVGLVLGLLDRYWDTVHPMPEDGDYFMRMNAVSSLSEVTGLLRELRQVDFLRSSAGVVTVREAESLVKGTMVEGGHKMSLDQLRLAVGDAHRQDNPAVLALVSAAESLERIVELCVGKLPGAQRPEMQGLQALLGALEELMPSQGATLIDNATDAAQLPDADHQAKPVATPGVLCNRDEAIAQLLAIAAFVEKTEPTNPAPLLIRRAARLMRMGFMDILRELSPGSLSQIENIIGGSTPP